jgi:putative transposase
MMSPRFSRRIRSVIAQIDILQPNSLIEACWRSMKHRYSSLNKLDSLDVLKPFVAFFVEQHNVVVPHSAFAGQTPDEMYVGAAPDLLIELAALRTEARRERLLANKNASCGTCRPPTPAWTSRTTDRRFCR